MTKEVSYFITYVPLIYPKAERFRYLITRDVSLVIAERPKD